VDVLPVPWGISVSPRRVLALVILAPLAIAIVAADGVVSRCRRPVRDVGAP